MACQGPKSAVIALDNKRIYPISKEGVWGYAALGGHMIIDYQFEDALPFNQDWAGIKQNDKYGFIDHSGEIFIKPKYDSILIIHHNKAFVQKNDRTYWINKKGKKLKEVISIINNCGEPLLCSEPLDYLNLKDNNYTLKDEYLAHQQRLDPTAGFTKSDFIFQDAKAFSSKSFIVKKQNQFGVFCHYNHIGLHKDWYDEIVPIFYTTSNKPFKGKFEAQIAKVRKGKKWGFINSFGHTIIEAEFLSIKHVTGSLYLVEYKPKHWGHLLYPNKRYF